MTIHQIKPEVNKEIKNQLVNNYGLIVSSITKQFGISSLEHVQMVAKNSFEEAQRSWSVNGIPKNPENYIWNSIVESSNKLFCRKLNYLQKVSRNKRIDIKNFHFDFPNKSDGTSNQLELLFAIIDKNIDYETRKYLVLDLLCGFSCSSLARIFGKNEKLLEKEILTEKKKIINGEARLSIPSGKLADNAIYRAFDLAKELFYKGYNCNNTEKTVFPELCHSAIKLTRLLADNKSTAIPETHALLAWMLFNSSRLNSMQDEKGNLLTLREQDRSLWDTGMIEEGFFHLHESANGDDVTKIHLEAGVSAVHSLSSDYRSTNWDQIIFLYDNYLAYNHCPSVELERAIAISKQKGPEEGIYAINNIRKKNKLDSDDLLYSTLGNLNLQLHKYETAISNFRRAFDLTDHSFDKSFYSKKIKICQQRIDMSKRYGQSLSF